MRVLQTIITNVQFNGYVLKSLFHLNCLLYHIISQPQTQINYGDAFKRALMLWIKMHFATAYHVELLNDMSPSHVDQKIFFNKIVSFPLCNRTHNIYITSWVKVWMHIFLEKPKRNTHSKQCTQIAF